MRRDDPQGITAGGGAEARVLFTRSPDETRALGRALGLVLFPGSFVALTGDLGSGKTVLVQGIAEGLEAGDVASPSFVIVNEYRGRIPIYHVDLYRIADTGALEDIGYRELFYGDGAALVEWADRAPEVLPADRVNVTLGFTFGKPSCRLIAVWATGPIHEAALRSASFWGPASGGG